MPTTPDIVISPANEAYKVPDNRAAKATTATAQKSRTGETMLSLQWYGSKDVRVVEAPVPAISEPTDAICRVTGTSVCDGDLQLYYKEPRQLVRGDILGYEWMGIVDEIGPEVKNLKVGDRVVASSQVACGSCKACTKRDFSKCSKWSTATAQQKFHGRPSSGLSKHGHFIGGQAEYARCPFADVNLIKVPDSIPDEKALYLSYSVPVSYHAVVCADIREGNSVAIWGAGSIGLYAAKWSFLAGARRVIVIDSVKEYLKIAEAMGCNAINFEEDLDVLSAIYKLEPEGVDCAIDTATRSTKGLLHTIQRSIGFEIGSSGNVNEALGAVKQLGTVSLVADYATLTNRFLLGALMEKGITLRGTDQTPVQKYWNDLMRKVENGEFDPAIILSHRFQLDELRELYDALDKGEISVLKTFIQTRFSHSPAPGTPQLSSLKSGTLKPSIAAYHNGV